MGPLSPGVRASRQEPTEKGEKKRKNPRREAGLELLMQLRKHLPAVK